MSMHRVRGLGRIVVAAACVVSAGVRVSAQDAGLPMKAQPREPTAAELDKAEQLYRDVYGADHDAATASKVKSDKVRFAQKLWDAAASVKDDPALARVLSDRALTFASSDPSGAKIALAIRREQAVDPRRRRTALREAAALLEGIVKTEKVADRPKAVRELVEVSRAAADEEGRNGDPTAGAALLVKAKAACRANLSTAAARELLDDIEADERELAAAGRAFVERNKIEDAIKKDPTDTRLRQALAVLLLRMGRTADAAARLAECREEPLRALGAALTKSPPAGDLELADAHRAAGWTAAAEHRTPLLVAARFHYEAALAADPMQKEHFRIRLLLDLLPGVEDLPPPPGATAPTPGAVTALLDDNRGLIDLINGANAAGTSPLIAETKDAYSGPISARIDGVGNGMETIPGWRWRIVEKPAKPDEFRWVRFAWKHVAGAGVPMIQFAHNGAWASPTDAKKVMAYHWSATSALGIKAADAAPAQWTVVTRDLYKDFGEFTLTGIGVFVQGGKAVMLADHVHLGRTVQDLNRIPVRKRPG